MMMRMLDAGGVPPVPGSQSVSYEMPSLSALLGVSDLAGHAVKVLDMILYGSLPFYAKVRDWRFIWLDRNPWQQALSQEKFVTWVMPGLKVDHAALMESYRVDRPIALGKLQRLGPVLTLAFEDLLADPLEGARSVEGFLDQPFDVEAAAAAVHKRGPKCLPDLSFEMSA
jgi:hypothetical protein